MQQPMQNLEDISDPTTAIDMTLVLMDKAFKLNITTPTNNNQRSSTNPRNRQNAQPGMNMDQDRHMIMVEDNVENQFRLNAGQIVENQNRYNALQNVGNQLGHNAVHNSNIQKIANQSGNGNVVAARAEDNDNGNNENQIRKRDATYLQIQLQIAQKEEAGIQLNYEEFYFMAAADEVHHSEFFYNNDIFNMFTQEEQYTGLLKPITEPQSVQRNTSSVIVAEPSVEHNRGTIEQHPATVEEIRAYFESLYTNLVSEVEKVNTVNHKMHEKNADLTIELARYKGQEKCFEFNQAKFDELENGYRKVLLEKHDPPAVYDSEETLQLAQESRLKMKQLNKEIKPANYTKINKISKVFVSQKAKSQEGVYFSNTSKTASVSNIISKPISIPKDEFSDHTPSVARKFINEVKDTIVTLQSVLKHRMNANITNWSSLAYQEFCKIIKDEIAPIVNQVDA
ncbi:hypothetical protein Tco_0738120 [Tanacetum coccineum]